MSKKNQQKNAKKTAAKKQAKQQTHDWQQSEPYQPSRPKKEPMSWQAVTKLVIVGLLVLGLVGSMSCGIIASAYGLPVQELQALSSAEQNERALTSSHQDALVRSEQNALSYSEQNTLASPARLHEGDIIDGKPQSDYASQTDDFPYVDSPMAGLCTTDGRILYERNIDTAVPMASTTKMMTAIIALETLPLEEPLTVTYGAANSIGTHSGLQEGMSISLHDCLYALLLPSGNDAAVVIAENVSGLESRFVELMNAKAAELGMTSTHYADSSGLESENHYSTVRDYLTLVRYCMQNETFRTIVGTGYYEVNINGTVLGFETTSKLSDYMTVAQPIGVKTGFTNDAGYCYVGAGNLGGIELYSVVFNAATSEQRFADTAELLEWGFRHYRTIELINSTQQVGVVALTSWIDKSVDAYVPAAVRVEIFDLAGPIQQNITINDIEDEATKGQTCGEIVWLQNGEVLTTSKVIIDSTVLAPGFFEGLGIAWDRFWGGFSGAPQHAETQVLLKEELNIPAAPTSTEAE